MYKFIALYTCLALLSLYLYEELAFRAAPFVKAMFYRIESLSYKQRFSLMLSSKKDLLAVKHLSEIYAGRVVPGLFRFNKRKELKEEMMIAISWLISIGRGADPYLIPQRDACSSFYGCLPGWYRLHGTSKLILYIILSVNIGMGALELSLNQEGYSIFSLTESEELLIFVSYIALWTWVAVEHYRFLVPLRRAHSRWMDNGKPSYHYHEFYSQRLFANARPMLFSNRAKRRDSKPPVDKRDLLIEVSGACEPVEIVSQIADSLGISIDGIDLNAISIDDDLAISIFSLDGQPVAKAEFSKGGLKSRSYIVTDMRALD